MPVSFYVYSRTFVANLRLSPSFMVTFDALVPRLATSTEQNTNAVMLFELVHQTAGTNLLAMGLGTTVAVRPWYDGTLLDTFSVNFKTNLASATSFKIQVLNDKLLISTSDNWAWTEEYPITMLDTTGNLYSLYVSSPSDADPSIYSNVAFTRKSPSN